MSTTESKEEEGGKLANLRRKMESRRANQKRHFEDPFEQLVHLLASDDARLAPNVFIEYSALLIQSYAGSKGTFRIRENMTAFFAFGEGQYGLIGVPDRRTEQTSLCFLNEHFEWCPHGGFDLGGYAHGTPRMVFLDCGRQQVARNVIRNRHICVFTPLQGVWIPQRLVHGPNEDHLLYVVTSTYGLGLDGDTRSPVCTPEMLLVRKHANQNVLHIWKQGRKIYVLVAFVKAVLEFELYEINAVFDETHLETPVQVDMQKVFETKNGPKFNLHALTRLSGAWFDEEKNRVLGCTEPGRFLMVFGDENRTSLLDENESVVALFGYLEDYQAYFGISRDGKVFVVDVPEDHVEGNPVVDLRQVSEFSIWGLKTGSLCYNSETQMVHFVSQLLSSSTDYKYAMTVFPIVPQLFQNA